jgi:hypothetical protein
MTQPLIVRAACARDQGDAAGVREYGEQSLAILRKLGVPWAIGFTLNNLALAAYYVALTEALQLASTVGPRLLVAATLEELAGLVVSQGHADLPTRLLAAAVLRTQMGMPVRPVDQAAVERALVSARLTLGDDAFAAVWAAAQAQPLEQILGAVPSAAALDLLR